MKDFDAKLGATEIQQLIKFDQLTPFAIIQRRDKKAVTTSVTHHFIYMVEVLTNGVDSEREN